jgi:hypothetical protein
MNLYIALRVIANRGEEDYWGWVELAVAEARRHGYNENDAMGKNYCCDWLERELKALGLKDGTDDN